MVGKRRRKLSSSSQVHNVKQAGDMDYDVRSERRWKRREISVRDRSLIPTGDNRFNKGDSKCIQPVIDCVDVNGVDETDSDYREFLTGSSYEALEDGVADYCGNGVMCGDREGVIALQDKGAHDASDNGSLQDKSNNGKDEDYVDSDYEKYFSIEGIGSGDADNLKSMETCDIDRDRVIENMLMHDVADTQNKATHRCNSITADDNGEVFLETDYVNLLTLESFADGSVGGNNFCKDVIHVDAVVGPSDKDSSTNKLVDNISAEDHISCNNVNSSGAADLETEEIPESINLISDNDVMDAADKKLDDEPALVPSDDGPTVYTSAEISSSGDKLVENELANDHKNNNNDVCALDDMDLHNKNIDESNRSTEKRIDVSGSGSAVNIYVFHNRSSDMDPMNKKVPESNSVISCDHKLGVYKEKFIDASGSKSLGKTIVCCLSAGVNIQNKKVPKSNNIISHNDKVGVYKEKFIDGSTSESLGKIDICYKSANVNPLSNNLHESIVVEAKKDNLDADNEKFVDGSVLGSGNRDDCNDRSADMDHQNMKIPKSINKKSCDDKLVADNEKNIDSSLLKCSGHDVVHCDLSTYDVAVEPDNVNRLKEKDTHLNCSTKNMNVSGGSMETRSANNNVDHCIHADPHYGTFLKNVKLGGVSYVLEVPGSDGISKIILYEKDDISLEPKRKRPTRKASGLNKRPRRSHNFNGAENCKRSRPVDEDVGWTEHHCKRKMECDDVDQSYSIYLNCLEIEGNNVVFAPKMGAKVVIGEDESSDSDLIVMDSDPYADKDYSPFVISKTNAFCDEDNGDEWIKHPSKKPKSWFRENLIKILRKPFDQKEYEQLLKEIKSRKPVEMYRTMRNGRDRVYTAEKLGHSYLDLHNDFANKVFTARSKPKVLNLIRGFFFWLQNIAHDGVFYPWTDPLCLEVMPSGSHP